MTRGQLSAKREWEIAAMRMLASTRDSYRKEKTTGANARVYGMLRNRRLCPSCSLVLKTRSAYQNNFQLLLCNFRGWLETHVRSGDDR